MDNGKKFSEELSLEEVQDVAEKMSSNMVEKEKIDMILNGKIVTPEMEQMMKSTFKDNIIQGKTKAYQNGRGFFEVIKGELKEIPTSVFINVAGKQRNLAKEADKLSNLISIILKNPGAIAQIPGVGKVFNELLEDSGLSPIDFTQITQAPLQVPNTPAPNQPPNNQPIPSPMGQTLPVATQ
jgi:hypothetical protein